jgi:glycosyltransferase involved in cell wall biosynthesis
MVKFFNIDLHIAVIADIKNIIKTLYGDQVEIIDWSLSNHIWIFDRQPDQVDIVNQHTWIFFNLDMVKAFHQKYDEFLSQFDGFIVTHSPVFCMLFEKYNKPIILINSCRYQMPFCFKNDQNYLIMWDKLDHCLKRLQQNGKLIGVSNNKGDMEFLKLGNGVITTHLPSLCLYTNSKYSPSYDQFIIHNNGNTPIIEGTIQKKELGEKYKWETMYKYKGIIHIPYELSLMSIFEEYSANIPLLFPSKKFLKELIHTAQIIFISCYMKDGYPSKFDSVLSYPYWIDYWVDKADYYDETNMPYIVYFDNFEHLRYLIKTINTQEISNQMKEWNEKRQNKIYTKWHELIKCHFTELQCCQSLTKSFLLRPIDPDVTNQSMFLNMNLYNKKKLPGFSFMIRTKNEQENIETCLTSLQKYIPSTVPYELIIIDNDSQDNTSNIASQLINHNRGDKVIKYPYQLAKPNMENYFTPVDSIHSFIYFTQFCMMQCEHEWIFRWDANFEMTSSLGQWLKIFWEDHILKQKYNNYTFDYVFVPSIDKDENINTEGYLFHTKSIPVFYRKQLWEQLAFLNDNNVILFYELEKKNALIIHQSSPDVIKSLYLEEPWWINKLKNKESFPESYIKILNEIEHKYHKITLDNQTFYKKSDFQLIEILPKLSPDCQYSNVSEYLQSTTEN